MNKTTEAFDAWWSDTGEQSLFALNTTTDDDIKILAGIAWEAAIREVLADHIADAGKVIAEPVKQEPVAIVVEVDRHGDATVVSGAWQLDGGTHTFYAAPVDAKAIRAEVLEQAAKVCRTAQAQGLQSIREAIEEAIRGLK